MVDTAIRNADRASPSETIRLLTDSEVQSLLPIEDCIDAMRIAFKEYGEGKAVGRPRTRYVAETPDPGRQFLATLLMLWLNADR